ncbi:MAG: HEAT repeat domain-containing protein [Nitrospinota bacterium]|nr:MAG: HEAT repeat domain-containing protein [Nitrospinota bacterium]
MLENFWREFNGLPLHEQRARVRELASLEEENLSENHAPLYLGFMQHPDPEIRKTAVGAMWYYPEEEYLEILLHLCKTDPDDEVRGKAASVLGRYIYEGWVLEEFDPTLTEHLIEELLRIAENESESVTVRRFAIESLGFVYDNPRVLNLIENAYFSPEEAMRQSAIFAMGRNGNERWVSYLLSSLREQNKSLLLEAISACGEAQIQEAFPLLKEFCFHTDKDIRLEAIWALGKLGTSSALQTLYLCTQDQDEEIRTMAQEAIEELSLMTLGNRLEAGEEFDEDLPADWPGFSSDLFADMELEAEELEAEDSGEGAPPEQAWDRFGEEFDRRFLEGFDDDFGEGDEPEDEEEEP